jgi:hypothetical protein
MACFNTILQMVDCDPSIHVFWVWLLLAVSAPFMKGVWITWVAVGMIATLAAVMLLSHFSERLPGQKWLNQLTLIVDQASPRPHPENYPLRFWSELWLRCLINTCMCTASVFIGTQLGVAEFWFPVVAFFTTFFVVSRLEEKVGMRLLYCWWILLAWCCLAYYWIDMENPAILIVALNANLAHLLTTHTEKINIKPH